MVPFLLPLAIVVFFVIGTGLILFLRGYQVARPGMALILARPNGEPRVLFDGGAFSLPRHAQLLDMSPRTVTVSLHGAGRLHFGDGDADATLTIRLSPNQSVSDVLAISRSLGAAVANDPTRLGSRLEPGLREVAQRCAEALDVSSLTDGSLAAELGRKLPQTLAGFSLDACNVAAGP